MGKINSFIVKIEEKLSIWYLSNRWFFVFIPMCIFLYTGWVIYNSYHINPIEELFYSIGLFISFLLFFFLVHKERRKWLSSHANRELLSLQKQQGVQLAWFKNFYSKVDIKYYCIFICWYILLYTAVFFLFKYNNIDPEKFSDNLKNLEQVFASFFSITVAIIIFGIDKTDSKFRNFSTIFYKKTKINFIFVLGVVYIIFSLVHLMIEPNNFYLFVFDVSYLIINLFLIIFLFRAYILNINIYKFSKYAKEAIKAEIDASLTSEILYKIKEYILFTKIKKFNYSFISRDNPKSFFPYIVESKKYGFVTDINLELLFYLSEKIKTKSNNQKIFSYLVNFNSHVRIGELLLGLVEKKI